MKEATSASTACRAASYYTVAAGPVRNAPSATAMPPNVLVGSASDTVNLLQLSLGGPCAGRDGDPWWKLATSSVL